MKLNVSFYGFSTYVDMMQSRHSKPSLILHIGVGKTATTTLQESFFPLHPGIDYLGKSHHQGDKHSGLRAAIRELIINDTIDFDPEAVRKHAQSSCDGSGIPVYSDENIIDGSRDKGMIIERIARTFPDCKIILTIREQRAFLSSLYGHDNNKLKGLPSPCNGAFISIDDWLDYKVYELGRQAGPLYLIRYDKLIGHLHKVMGPENVGVFLFEEFVSDRTAYLQKLCSFIGVGYLPGLDDEIGRAHFNPEVASRWLQKHLWMERKKQEGSLLAANPQLLRLAGSLYSNRHKTPAPPDFSISQDWDGRLCDLFRESNRACMEQFGLPLSNYGYAT